jgi:hypothetical protein
VDEDRDRGVVVDFHCPAEADFEKSSNAVVGDVLRFAFGVRRMGDTAQEPGNGRVKNSARPRFGSFATLSRAGFERRRGL